MILKIAADYAARLRIIASETAERAKSALNRRQLQKNFSAAAAIALVTVYVTTGDAAR
jgi:hypothetical protein